MTRVKVDVGPSGIPEWNPAGHIGQLALVFVVYLAYYPLNQYLADVPGRDLTLAIDLVMPFSLWWIFFYALIFSVAFLPGLVVKHPRLLRRAILAYILVEFVALTTFVVWPVKMTLRPEFVDTSSFAAWSVTLCYYIDHPTTCFPSLHVAISVLAALVVRRADRPMGNLILVIAGLICASTMFVKQHYFADVVGGLILAGGAYWWVVFPLDLGDAPERAVRFPRTGALILLGLNLAAFAVCYGLYRSGWAPWAQ